MISSLQLAKLCGVSQGTVDRALHGRGRISEQTRRLVLEAAEKHGYAPHPAVRELMTGRSDLVLAIVPSINTLFFMDMMETMRQALHGRGLRMLIEPVAGGAEAAAAVAEAAARRMAGCIVIPPEEGIAIPPAHGRRMKVVGVLNPCASGTLAFVAPDEVAAGRDGVEYLHGRGHRRILFLSYPRRSWAIHSREQGYRAAMRANGCEPRMLTNVTEERLRGEVGQYQPTAVFCHNDWLALSAIRYLHKWGRKVPQEVSVLGIDNSPSFVALCPEITTMEYPVADVADRVARLIAGKGRPLTRPVRGFRIVERETVAQAPA